MVEHGPHRKQNGTGTLSNVSCHFAAGKWDITGWKRRDGRYRFFFAPIGRSNSAESGWATAPPRGRTCAVWATWLNVCEYAEQHADGHSNE